MDNNVVKKEKVKKTVLQKVLSIFGCVLFLLTALSFSALLFTKIAIPAGQHFYYFVQDVIHSIAYGSMPFVAILLLSFISLVIKISLLIPECLPLVIIIGFCLFGALSMFFKKTSVFQIVVSALFVLATAVVLAIRPLALYAKVVEVFLVAIGLTVGNAPSVGGALLSFVQTAASLTMYASLLLLAIFALVLSIASVVNCDGFKKFAKVFRFFFIALLVVALALVVLCLVVEYLLPFIGTAFASMGGIVMEIIYMIKGPAFVMTSAAAIQESVTAAAIFIRIVPSVLYILFTLGLLALSFAALTPAFTSFVLLIAAVACKQFASSNYAVKKAEIEEKVEGEESADENAEENNDFVEDFAQEVPQSVEEA